MSKQVVLITGASKGIGLELAKCFAQEDYDLVLVARNADELHAVAEEMGRINKNITARVLPADLARPEAAEEIRAALQEQSVTVDVLVNNAGFGWRGMFAQAEPQLLVDMLEVNVVALTRLTRVFLPAMIERREGGIINVASVAGFFPGPLMSVYYATKAYVISLSEALANEVKGTGVVVSCLCPGATATHFQKRADLDGAKLFSKNPVMSAAAVAEEGYKGFKRGETIVITGVSNKFAVAAGRLVPRSIAAGMARKMAEK